MICHICHSTGKIGCNFLKIKYWPALSLCKYEILLRHLLNILSEFSMFTQYGSDGQLAMMTRDKVFSRIKVQPDTNINRCVEKNHQATIEDLIVLK